MRAGWTVGAFLLPGGLVYVALFVFPTLAAFYVSVTDWRGLEFDAPFIGTANYATLLGDRLFQTVLANNLRFTTTVLVGQTVLALVFALLLVRNSRYNVVLRTIFFTPLVISSVSIAFAWQFMYDPNIGVLNLLLRGAGLGGFARTWLGDPGIAIYALAWVQMWIHIGEVMLIFIAGLQTIPEELYEVGRLEGAGPWQRFRFITWPLLAPATAIVLALTTIQSFRAFDLILVMTDGGPAQSTSILSLFIYQQAFAGFRFGYASAAAVIFMFIIAVITFFQFRLLQTRRVQY
jgi:raffinose/stachyose/melibiose transport system permease protein